MRDTNCQAGFSHLPAQTACSLRELPDMYGKSGSREGITMHHTIFQVLMIMRARSPDCSHSGVQRLRTVTGNALQIYIRGSIEHKVRLASLSRLLHVHEASRLAQDVKSYIAFATVFVGCHIGLASGMF